MSMPDTKRLISTKDDAKGFVKESVDKRRSLSWQFMSLNINHPDYESRVNTLAKTYYHTWLEESKCRKIFKLDSAGYLPDWVEYTIHVKEESNGTTD